jgi:large subunit ribosomal protein L18e
LPKPTGPSNPITVQLINELRKKGREDKKYSFWNVLSERLGKPRRQRPVVNLSKISRYANEGDLIVVPGKVLASGQLSKSNTIVALNFSRTAKEKILKAGGKPLSLHDLLELPQKDLEHVRILT